MQYNDKDKLSSITSSYVLWLSAEKPFGEQCDKGIVNLFLMNVDTEEHYPDGWSAFKFNDL